MNKGESNHLRIPLLGFMDLGRLARGKPAGNDGAHLHWDRRNRRWVTHEDARLGSSPARGGQAGRGLRRQ
jgi:hypothetical protein